MAGLEPGVSRETGVPATVVKAPLVACSVRAAGMFSLTKMGCDAGVAALVAWDRGLAESGRASCCSYQHRRGPKNCQSMETRILRKPFGVARVIHVGLDQMGLMPKEGAQQRSFPVASTRGANENGSACRLCGG